MATAIGTVARQLGKDARENSPTASASFVVPEGVQCPECGKAPTREPETRGSRLWWRCELNNPVIPGTLCCAWLTKKPVPVPSSIVRNDLKRAFSYQSPVAGLTGDQWSQLERVFEDGLFPERDRFGEWDKCSFVEQIREWSESFGSAVIIGSVGTGKTTAAGMMMALLAIAGWKSTHMAYTTAVRLFDLLHREETVSSPTALVIDDLGREFMSDRSMALTRFDRLVDERNAKCQRTIVTSNLSIDLLRDRYERIVDRLLQDAMVIEIGGRSLR